MKHRYRGILICEPTNERYLIRCYGLDLGGMKDGTKSRLGVGDRNKIGEQQKSFSREKITAAWI